MPNPLSRIAAVFVLASLFFVVSSAARAQSRYGSGGGENAAASYESFTTGATEQHGLFTIWHKDGKVYLELRADQLNRDYVQTIVPASGLGGNFVVWGNTDHLPAEIVRFEPAGRSIAILWPSPNWIAPGDPAAERALAVNFPRSIVGLMPIAARDERTGTVVVNASTFLQDQLNLKNVLKSTGGTEPYRLDEDRTYFGPTKAFPQNVVIEADQAWTSEGQRLDDVPPDARSIQMHVVYNIAEPPHDDDYRPRLADDRIGLYQDFYLQFSNDQVLTRKMRYLIRWNIQPSDPSKPMSPAKHPMVFYMSNTVPEKYRAGIRNAVLMWNDAFVKIGISDAIQVRDQPDDPNWDPDDIRYSVLRWVPESSASFGADSQTLYDPRTGQEFRTGILISADVPLNAFRGWTYLIDPVRNGRTTDPMPSDFVDNVWMGTIMHETGHNLGMQHNFIGHAAYTAKQLQDPDFTARNGTTTTVMEYAPTNIWPHPYGQGAYGQTVLGPYDYFLMKWGYATIPGANTPEAEWPTLEKWAEAWSDPLYRYASDEDVDWGSGHAADPRVGTGLLTDDPLGWCQVQLPMYHSLINHLDERFPRAGQPYQDETDAFNYIQGRERTCQLLPAHYLGGQYLSRAHRGDPHADPAVVPVPKNVQKRAFDLLARNVFADDAWRWPAKLLQHLGTQEWAGYGYVEIDNAGNVPLWAYDPRPRHDIAPSQIAAGMQRAVLEQIFQPVVLARIVDGPAESTENDPMRLSDLFDWMDGAVFSELHGAPRSISPVRRNLQLMYARTLSDIASNPKPGMPEDARSLAAAGLRHIAREAEAAKNASGLDETTRAHLAALAEATHTGGMPQAGGRRRRG